MTEYITTINAQTREREVIEFYTHDEFMERKKAKLAELKSEAELLGQADIKSYSAAEFVSHFAKCTRIVAELHEVKSAVGPMVAGRPEADAIQFANVKVLSAWAELRSASDPLLRYLPDLKIEHDCNPSVLDWFKESEKECAAFDFNGRRRVIEGIVTSVTTLPAGKRGPARQVTTIRVTGQPISADLQHD